MSLVDFVGSYSIDSFDELYFNFDPYHAGEQKGNWYSWVTPNSRGAEWAWGWGALGWALSEMFFLTKERMYLELMIPQIDWIIARRDIDLKVESYSGTGLSLPAWSDDGYYSGSAKFAYVYRVHTAMICFPILRFVQAVYLYNMEKHFERAKIYLEVCKNALRIHNNDRDWADLGPGRGYYKGAPYGIGIVDVAGKIEMPNRVHAYIMACGLYDCITGADLYRTRIENCLRQFKTWLRYDPLFDAYFWSYWPSEYGEKGWEDISHAQLTMFGFLFLDQLGYHIYTLEDLLRTANTAKKIVNDCVYPPLVMDNLMGTYQPLDPKNPSNYAQAAGWAPLSVIDPTVLIKTQKINYIIYQKVIKKEIKLIPAYLRNFALNW